MFATAFARFTRIAAGPLAEVAPAGRRFQLAAPDVPVLIFDDATGGVIDLDLRGTDSEILARLPVLPQQAAARAPGRPKLGVVPREVTLLPRHWDWLSAQPGGASATLRRLVEDARKADGLILLGYGDYEVYRGRQAQLIRQGTHFVRWGAVGPDEQDGRTIGCDNRAGGWLAGKHLIARGRRRIAFLADKGVVDGFGHVSARHDKREHCPFTILPGGSI